MDASTVSGISRAEGPMIKLLDKLDGCMSKIFRPFANNPQQSVHRAWGLCLISLTILFIAACVEAKLMRSKYGSSPIVFAAIWTALAQMFMGAVGTFVLRRFPTEFSVGFFLGLLVIVAQQNLILFATFSDGTFNMLSEQKSSKVFAALILLTAIIYIAFAIMLTHFRDHILLAPADVKSVISRLGSMSHEHDNNSEDRKNYNEFDDHE